MPEEPQAEPQAETGAGLIVHSTLTYRVTRVFTGLELGLMHRFKHSGSEHVPASGPALIVSNHQSFLDIPIIANAVPGYRHVCFVARESLARSKPLAWLMRKCGAVLIRRGAAERTSLNAMIEHLKAGDLVCVFPEGTRSADGSLGEFLPGATFAAKRARVPLIPAGIRGAHRAMPRGSKWPFPRPRRISVAFGAPIDSQAKDALAQAQAAVQELVGDGEIEP